MRKILFITILTLFMGVCLGDVKVPVQPGTIFSKEKKLMATERTDSKAGSDITVSEKSNGAEEEKSILQMIVPVLSSLDRQAGDCGAYVAPGVWKEFDCYNLAAIGKTTSDDPFTPSWRLIGGYWQWGRKGPDSSQWYNTNTANFAHGPTSPDSGDANDTSISGWDDTDAPDGAWSHSEKTVYDPCPAGYRIPTESQWQGMIDNNTPSTVGTWSDSATNYSSARSFGDHLMLPAAGYRRDSGGSLRRRGIYGVYWSSTQYASTLAWHLYFRSAGASMHDDGNRSFGFSVRCIAE